ncbi:MAG TPA: mechanosensitive ion channel domain-containing protein [Opitutaceae bacterium]|nr:mechanosensitive ion channel domain-containing protein [Opitutaceae bacterium]
MEASPLSIVIGLALVAALFIAVSIIKRILRDGVLPKAGLSRAGSSAVATLTAYGVLTVGMLTILPITFPGFNLSTLSVMLGAISFGIGFGLRNIADNFVSGLILLFEQPIKVGDRIEVRGTAGEVLEVRARSTIVRTNDHIEIIVPNSQLLSEQVTNWSHSSNRVRLRIPVGVHYKSDVRVVEKALLEAASEVEGVMTDPAPTVNFAAFGESSLDFQLWVWTETMSQRPQNLRGQVNFKIWDKLKKHGIEIPYPQRDIYVKEWPGKDGPDAQSTS